MLTIVIVSWNTREILAACLESVANEIESWPQDTVETFVVDNGSSDGTQEMITIHFPWVRLIKNRSNVGFARANNQVIKRCQSSYVLLLNSDTVVHPGAFQILLEFMDCHPSVGACGPLLLNGDASLQSSCDPEPTVSRELWRLLHLDKAIRYSVYDQKAWCRTRFHETDVLKGACMLIRCEALNQTGGFDEEYFFYSEEVDLCKRIRQNGWSIYWVPQATVTHLGGQSTRLVANEMFQNLYKYKLLYFRKHYGDFRANLYKCVLGIGALARIITVPVATRFGDPAKRCERQMLFANYRRLLFSLPGM